MVLPGQDLGGGTGEHRAESRPDFSFTITEFIAIIVILDINEEYFRYYEFIISCTTDIILIQSSSKLHKPYRTFD
jgi:hypothetical protein